MINKCTKHPKYNGKRQPKYECLGCLNLYVKLHLKPRSPHKPTSQMKDKRAYTRKTKHKNRK